MTTPARRIGLGALACVLLALAACSSGGSDAAKDPTTTGGKADTTTTEIAEITGDPIERYADYETVNYDDPSHWVCRPDLDDICDSGLDATSIAADGTLTVEPFEAAAEPPVDCFYVYPTISRDKGAYSDWEASPDEEGYVTLNQAARLQSECRLFAPVYRQGTLGGLASRIGGGETEEEGDPYADVLDAFRTYMAQDNHGRGVVLVGHSQGTGMLAKLIAEEIDPNEDVREQLVGAYLAGGSIAVPEGETTGGEFDSIPLCTEEGEAGCVVTWSTFRSTSPPPSDSFFGRPSGDGKFVAGCVNPAAIGGGPGDLDAYLPANSDASILSSLGTTTEGKSWVDASAGDVTTPFVRLPGLVTGTCETTEGDVTYLSAEVNEDPGPRADDIVGDLTPQWGLHLVDVNLVMGNLVEDVKAQAATYTGN